MTTEIRITAPDESVYRVVADGKRFRVRHVRGFHGEWLRTSKGHVRRWESEAAAQEHIEKLVRHAEKEIAKKAKTAQVG